MENCLFLKFLQHIDIDRVKGGNSFWERTSPFSQKFIFIYKLTFLFREWTLNNDTPIVRYVSMRGTTVRAESFSATYSNIFEMSIPTIWNGFRASLKIQSLWIVRFVKWKFNSLFPFPAHPALREAVAGSSGGKIPEMKVRQQTVSSLSGQPRAQIQTRSMAHKRGKFYNKKENQF